MTVQLTGSVAELDGLAEQWNALSSGHPFQSWDWLGAWWRAFGAGRELYVLLVHDSCGRLRRAPWFRETSARQGRVLRFLGSGSVCTDYSSLICPPEHREFVARAVAEWLDDASTGDNHRRWDLLRLENILVDDLPLLRLVERLRAHSCTIVERPGVNCWSTPLPASWDDFLMMLSKTHRKTLRKLDRRYLQQPRFQFRQASTEEQLRRGMDLLVDLHQRRWRELGEPGCFACDRFSRFLSEATESLFAKRQVQLSWLEDEGAAVSAQISFSHNSTVFVYQGGFDPAVVEYPSGNLLLMQSVKRAIEAGAQSFDFLRGDEPYKSHWRAKPSACCDWRIAPPRRAAQLRNKAWLAGDAVKQAIKHGLKWGGWSPS